jgi:hypothetical protein
MGSNLEKGPGLGPVKLYIMMALPENNVPHSQSSIVARQNEVAKSKHEQV